MASPGSLKKDSRDPYRAVHYQVRRAKGRASLFACIDCGQQASDWSLKRHVECVGVLSVVRVVEDPASPLGEPRWFSDDLSDYRPRCRLDHVRADRRERQAFIGQWERILDETRVYDGEW